MVRKSLNIPGRTKEPHSDYLKSFPRFFEK
jgi:hypothetical protein